MDLMMPKYDGYYGIKKIKEYDNNAKIIVVSGPASNVILLNDYKVLDIIRKPIDMKKIENAVNIIMHEKLMHKMK
jgi:two-component system, chemotaxis family, chemotaxis protein CheY